jgi:U3 small nucleolar RNA-associated protein 14
LLVKAGWGDWAGPGEMVVSKKILDKRNKLVMQVQKDNEIKKLERKDAKLSNVMISERRITNAAKYKVGEVPYPFKSREEYERSLQLPLGGKCWLL